MNDRDVMPATPVAEGERYWRGVFYRRAAGWLDQHPHPFLEGRSDQAGGAGDLAGACEWVLLRHHLPGAPPISRDDGARWMEQLQRCQVPSTGGFHAPLAAASDATSMDPDASERALTALGLQAMQALGGRPAVTLQFLQDVETPAGVAAWWESRDWSNAARAGDDVTALLGCLVHRAEAEHQPRALGAYHWILDRLDARQDPKTGLVGATGDNFPWRSIVASHGVISCFAYVHRPVQRASRIVDALFSLEERDDGFARTRGTAREALAAVMLLTLLGRHSSYRAGDVQAALRRTYDAIAQLQSEDGSVPAGAGRDGADGLVNPEPASLHALWLRVLTMTAIEGKDHADPAWAHASTSQSWPGPGGQGLTEALSPHERAVLPRWVRPSASSAAASGRASVPAAVTVVVPCFNLGRYLHEAIESVLAQTSQDFEIIIIDDGSTDEYTRLLLDHFERPRTRIVHQPNRGLAAARNEGIRLGSGRYICCLDPDDRLRPAFFARALAALDADPAVGLVSGHFEMFDEREGTFRFDSCGFPRLLVHNPAVEPAVFRREGWVRAGGYCTTFSASGIEDWDLWISLIELGYRAEVIPETVWDYRIRTDQMSTGMYQPDTWSRLVQELVARHEASYREHLAAVIGLHAHHWAELRRWTTDREHALGWWERQAGNWERLAAHRERLVAQLQARVAQLEEARPAADRQS